MLGAAAPLRTLVTILASAPRRARCRMLHAEAINNARLGIHNLGETQHPYKIIESAAEAQSFVESHDAFLFDCDGVLWRGDDGLLPDTIETLNMLESSGKRCVFVTNNAAKSRAEYATKFAKLGLDVTVEQVVPSSFVAARWLARTRSDVTDAFVIGADGLVAEMRDAGINVLTAHDFDMPGADPADNEASASLALLAQAVDNAASVGAVVVGHDTSFNFKSLCLASLFLERPGVTFVATNPDAYDVVVNRRMPGNGCFVAAVATVAGRQPDAVCGKPAQDLADYLVDAYSLDPTRTVMVGDRLDTDIALAHAMGASSLAVLTGVASADDLVWDQSRRRIWPMNSDGTPLPTHAVSHIGRLRELLG